MLVCVAWDYQGMVRMRCESWLTDQLLPLVLDAVRQRPASAAELVADLRRRPEIQQLQEDEPLRLSSAGIYAADTLGELRVVAIAVMVAHWAGETRASVEVRDAIAFLAFLSAVEQADAHDLVADLPSGEGHDALTTRAGLADAALECWRDLAEPAARAFLELVVELAADMPVQTNPFA
jgi:hypothetical protein